MRRKHVLIVLSVLAAMAAVAVVVVSAGNPNTPPGPPETTSSYRLEDIYDRLSTGAAGRQITFTEPISGPTVGTGYTLDEIMGIAPQADDTNGATASQVVSGRTYWGLQSGAWGMQTGTVTSGSNVTGGEGQLTFAIPDGFYTGSKTATAQDADLAAGNVRSGANLFGVAGDPNVVDTASGDATAADILSGKKAWVDGSEVTGTGTIATYAAPVPKTGQTISNTVGDDGDLEMGVDWITSTRFITGTTGVVTDTLTGLVWLENASCFGPSTWTQAFTDTATLNSEDCGLLDGSVAGDWRLPNLRELQSLIGYGEYTPAMPSGHPFSGVQLGNYWTSTSFAPTMSNAWAVSLINGSVGYNGKANSLYVWPVRAGQ